MKLSLRNLIIKICSVLILSSKLLSQNISFESLSTDDGLSNNHIYDVIQDNAGFIWLATDDGLNRFDGYNFKVYRNHPNDSASLSNNSVWCLLEDRQGFIWIGTKSGELNRYNPAKDEFEGYIIKSEIVKENSIKMLYEDSNGNIWIGTYKSGLYRFNPLTKKLDNWNTVAGDSQSLSNNYVTGIFEDSKKNFWVSTYHGFNKLNLEESTSKFQRFHHIPNNNNSLSHNIIWTITESEFNPNLIWLGTANGLTSFNTTTEIFTQIKIPNPNKIQFGESAVRVIEEVQSDEKILWINSYAGLIRYNLNTGHSVRFLSDENNYKSLISNQINNMVKDRSGVIWIATQNGLGYFSSKSLRFNAVYLKNSEFFDPSPLTKKNITTVAQSKDGKIWFGTEDGLYYCELGSVNPKVSKHSALNGVNIWSFTESSNNELWIGTFGSGLFNLNLRNFKITPFVIDHPGMQTASKDYNKVVYHDRDGDLWVGFWGAGLGRIKKNSNKIEMWQNVGDKNPHAISYNDVWAICQDSKGRMWIGTNGGGLNLFYDIANGKFLHFVSNAKGNALSSNTIFTITESKFGKYKSTKDKTVLWVGTNNGLNKFVVNESESSGDFSNLMVEITSFTTNDGLHDNSINSVIEDENGNLWISTTSGISFFDVKKNNFNNFTKSDGLISTDFNTLSSLQSKEGIIFFGSTKGLNFFDPAQIFVSNYAPPVVITDFKIFNESVRPGENSSIEYDISKQSRVELSYNQDVFSFEFAALDYNSPHSIKYAYQLEGFDKDWIESGSRRFVTYTNLSPGKYIFKVKATNADGVWSEKATELAVIIKSPWYATGWALSSYIILIIAGLFAIRKFEKNRIKLRNELKMHEFEASKLREVEAMKSRFFANLSHEFRTPLMLIKGPVEQLREKIPDEKLQEHLKMIGRNTENLQQLIDQLLELSQLESASIPLRAKEENLVNIIGGLTFSFDSLAKQKNISLSFETELQDVSAWIDRDKLEKIINNLLSNAFKFTGEGGKVFVEIKKSENEKGFAEVIISDTGIGIAEDKLEKIFDRFYQADDSPKKKYSGSGIGLALVKELVELHKWNILVSSIEKEGTRFTLRIPLYDYLNENEKATEHLLNEEQKTAPAKYLGAAQPEEKIFSEKVEQPSDSKPTILIVEDSLDVRKYLTDLLKEIYNLIEAKDGEEGIEAARKNLVDLIISDVMMPKMDGIEFCRRIKFNWETSHIPIILLTAKAGKESKLEGLETGADDYLTKPFESRELFIRIKNLLDQRRRLREKFSKEIHISAEAITTNSVDNEFLEKAMQIADKNLDNADFTAEDFAREMFVSLSQLRRKLIAVTGQTPGEFLRTYRLKRAGQMILEKKLSITQIAFEVGFNSSSHFTKAFKQQFNCLPTEFAERANNN